jgi:hypothetical protein
MQNMDADVISDLRKIASQFAQAYQDPATSQETLRRLAADTEGALMAAATVGAVKEATVEPLIDDLHLLVEEKSSPAAA